MIDLAPRQAERVEAAAARAKIKPFTSRSPPPPTLRHISYNNISLSGVRPDTVRTLFFMRLSGSLPFKAPREFCGADIFEEICHEKDIETFYIGRLED
jgi:hypothetical protein